jgi:hypothetical protein
MRFLVIVGLALTCFSACIKRDKVITLPPTTGSTFAQVNMGTSYDTTIYYNLELGKEAGRSLQSTWDIALDCRATNNGIMLNAAKLMRAVNTGNPNINLVKTGPTIAPEEWGYDVPTRMLDSTFIRNLTKADGSSKKETYILKMGSGTKLAYYKLMVASVSATQYVLQYDTISGSSATSVVIGKDDVTNFVYFNLRTGKIVNVEPPKNTWDIKFTRYCHPFYNITPFIAYSVTGVLTNPSGVMASGDTIATAKFADFNLAAAEARVLSTHNDVIGYNWKDLPEITGQYVLKTDFIYTIETRNKHLYKLHFVDFYLNGKGGAPKFEYERLK